MRLSMARWVLGRTWSCNHSASSEIHSGQDTFELGLKEGILTDSASWQVVLDRMANGGPSDDGMGPEPHDFLFL